MTDYTIWDRYSSEEKEISEQEALAIVKAADLYTGPYGGMGSKIDQVLYTEDEGSEPVVLAVHHAGEWLAIPESQNAFISHELSQNSYEG